MPESGHFLLDFFAVQWGGIALLALNEWYANERVVFFPVYYAAVAFTLNEAAGVVKQYEMQRFC